MARVKIRIVEKTSDGGEPTRFDLGTVLAPEGMTADQAGAVIQEAWGEFYDTQPDSDSQIIDYLVENHGFAETEDDFVTVTVEG